MSSISAISSTIKRTIPFCSSIAASSTTTKSRTIQFLRKPSCPSASQILTHELSDSPDQYPTRSPPEFSPPVLGRFDQPSTPVEVPAEIPEDPTSTPQLEVSPYLPLLDPGLNSGPDFPVPPLSHPLVPDIPPPFPDNPLPKSDVLSPQPPNIVPLPPPGQPIILPPTPPPPPTGSSGPLGV